jgi:16S rRNA (cytosine967-C5)-methyltransferase
VNETTELARYLRRPRWTGFLNGTLRSIARGLLEEFTDAPATNAFPLSQGQYRKCAGEWFPDPETDPLGYFAAAFSFPSWLAARWHRGRDFEELTALGFWFNSPPRLILRVNRLRASREEVLETFRQENIPAEAGELDESIVLLESQNITLLPGFAEGLFTVQDLTAMRAVALLDPRPGESVWDVCAAPGTKTTAMAERMQNQGRVLATDIHAARLQMIQDNKARLGLGIIEVEPIGARGEDVPAGPFDAALVDVPCSNTGVLGKRAEARWRITPIDLQELPEIQRRLLETARERIKPGGRVVYSTCSIEPEENQKVVEAFLNSRPDWKLVQQQTHWPGQPADGGFAALLQHIPATE